MAALPPTVRTKSACTRPRWATRQVAAGRVPASGGPQAAVRSRPDSTTKRPGPGPRTPGCPAVHAQEPAVTMYAPLPLAGAACCRCAGIGLSAGAGSRGGRHGGRTRTGHHQGSQNPPESPVASRRRSHVAHQWAATSVLASTTPKSSGLGSPREGGVPAVEETTGAHPLCSGCVSGRSSPLRPTAPVSPRPPSLFRAHQDESGP